MASFAVGYNFRTTISQAVAPEVVHNGNHEIQIGSRDQLPSTNVNQLADGFNCRVLWDVAPQLAPTATILVKRGGSNELQAAQQTVKANFKIKPKEYRL